VHILWCFVWLFLIIMFSPFIYLAQGFLGNLGDFWAKLGCSFCIPNVAVVVMVVVVVLLLL
jgi:hypothetical protein